MSNRDISYSLGNCEENCSSAEVGLYVVASAETGMMDSSWKVLSIATALTAGLWCSQAEG